jgi:hypothetical protein
VVVWELVIVSTPSGGALKKEQIAKGTFHGPVIVELKHKLKKMKPKLKGRR